MISIFSIDDHKMLVDSFIRHFDTVDDMEVVGYALSGEDAIAMLNPNTRESSPDIVLLDIGLGDMNGVECAKVLLSNDPNLKIIGLSTFMQSSVVKKMLKTGAKGYVSKSTDLAQLETAVRQVYNGESYLDKTIKESLLNAMLIGNDVQRIDKVIPTLTPREKEILSLIADEMNTKEISKELFISINTVETHRKNLISKFHVKNSIGLVRKAIEFRLIEV